MEVKYAIAHEIIKEQDKKDHDILLTDYLIEIEENDIKIIENLDNKYSRNSRRYYIFGKPTNFQDCFNSYLQNSLADNFIEFTKNVTKSLYEKIIENNKSKGGTLVFIEYISNRHYMYIFLLRKKKFPDLKLGEHRFKFCEIEHLNFDDMAMACKIDIDELLNASKKRYISFLSKRNNDEVSNYFKNWISVDNDGNDNKEDSEKLIDILSNLDLIKLGFNEKFEDNIILLKEAHKLIGANKKNVDLKMLSKQLFDDENIIIDYVNEHNISINTEFPVDNNVYKKFITIEVEDKYKNRLSFPKENFGKMVRISNDNKYLIIDSEEIVKLIIESFDGNKTKN